MQFIEKISLSELREMSQAMYGNLVKGVVDVARGTLSLDAPMHVDLEEFMLEAGSVQADLWGINLHPDKFGTIDFVEFDSMINIRPRANNMSRGIDDPNIQQQIRDIVLGVVHE